MPNNLRTSCAQYEDNQCTTIVEATTLKSGQCTTGTLYTFYTPSTRSYVHSYSVSFLSDIATVIPTVHTPYNEQKLIKLKLINTYLSGELL